MTAPEWRISEWLNSPEPLRLEAQRGRVVVACAFQMLCPGCVSHALPQMKEAHQLFAPLGVTVVGLHTVFEHHAAMTPTALKAFLHEYRIGFPVGIDTPGTGGDPMPQTMRAYGMQGTPTLLLYDRAGNLRRQVFGHVSDLRLGAEIMSLLNDTRMADGAGDDGTDGPACSVPD
ncbi:redoxin domain-containing protein [Oceanibacterium hippocampi]|uniref:Thiol-disulfide oxidoreductase n=1 Tax=Oceanibacterium hippocampi TaxID=745714 RepID=A0A1Y5TKG6_9PROT|nr:redoxin domain-containing protein [Oceanibacterium hippocampi]SLN64082.1 thiol-disulfide oxidoreductase [Oceanibacterium hippocampi]